MWRSSPPSPHCFCKVFARGSYRSAFRGTDQISCNAGLNFQIKHGSGRSLWCNLNGSGWSNNIPFLTSFQNSISVLYSLLTLTRCRHGPVLLRHVFYCAQNRQTVIEQGWRMHIGELGSTVRAAKGTDICSLSFGHSLSPLSYSKSKLTLLHSKAAPAPLPNCASSIGYSICKTSECTFINVIKTNKTPFEFLLLLVMSDEF